MAISKVIYKPSASAQGVTWIDATPATAAAADIMSPKTAMLANGVVTQGTGSGGITPTGNIDITQAGQTDVTHYATATVPSARTLAALNWQYVTENNERKWKATAIVIVDPEDGGQAGWIAEGTYGENTNTFSAIPTSTTVTPSTSPQTIGGANYMMEGPVTVAAMPSGTAGTPTATKSAVSNHSVSVTPSVTNTSGWITGSTKTGAAVTVTAAELESGTMSITQNGSGIDVTGFAAVDVDVPSGGVDFDTKTVTASNNPRSLQFTGMKGQPKAFVLRLNGSVSSSGSTTYYYIVDISAFGDTTHGNCFRIGSTRQVTSLTSGYSWSYSGTTLTITSSAASRSSSPGAFYNGSYELMYCY